MQISADMLGVYEGIGAHVWHEGSFYGDASIEPLPPFCKVRKYEHFQLRLHRNFIPPNP